MKQYCKFFLLLLFFFFFFFGGGGGQAIDHKQWLPPHPPPPPPPPKKKSFASSERSGATAWRCKWRVIESVFAFHYLVKKAAKGRSIHYECVVCIWERGRNIDTWIKEYNTSYKLSDKSTIVKHTQQHNHRIIWDNTQLTTPIGHYRTPSESGKP